MSKKPNHHKEGDNYLELEANKGDVDLYPLSTIETNKKNLYHQK